MHRALLYEIRISRIFYSSWNRNIPKWIEVFKNQATKLSKKQSTEEEQNQIQPVYPVFTVISTIEELERPNVKQGR